MTLELSLLPTLTPVPANSLCTAPGGEVCYSEQALVHDLVNSWLVYLHVPPNVCSSPAGFQVPKLFHTTLLCTLHLLLVATGILCRILWYLLPIRTTDVGKFHHIKHTDTRQKQNSWREIRDFLGCSKEEAMTAKYFCLTKQHIV